MKCTAILLLFSILAPMPAAAQCGKERWPVKTLQDIAGETIAAKAATDAKISELVLLQAPKRKVLQAATNRRFPSEKAVFRVSALVQGDKQEKDSDFHIVLADPQTPKNTIIAEIPAGTCTASKRSSFFDGLRTQFSQTFGPVQEGKLHPLANVAACVTGVGFFDFIHGQDGVAPNGFELHPVLDLKKGFCDKQQVSSLDPEWSRQ